jgi:hypothetical protein
VDNLPLQRQIFSLHYGQNYDGYYLIKKIMMATTLYTLWCEKNARLFS